MLGRQRRLSKHAISIDPLLLMSLIPTAGLTAQAATSAVFTAPPASQSCPVNFSAERKPNAGLEVVKGNEPPHGQGLQINFNWQPSNRASSKTSSITVMKTTALPRQFAWS